MDDDETVEAEIEPYPTEASGADWAQGLTKGGLGAVPFVGGILAEVTELLWTPRLERRRNVWLQGLAEKVESLSQKYDDLKRRLDDEAVLTVAVKAARAAVSTHEEEKHEALRNVVLNSALRVEPNVDVQQVLTELVGRLTGSHLRMLTFMADPAGWFDQHELEKPSLTMGAPSMLFQRAYPNWSREIQRLIVDDLERLGLLGGNFNTTMTGEGVWGNHASGLGRRLLKFIREPE